MPVFDLSLPLHLHLNALSWPLFRFRKKHLYTSALHADFVSLKRDEIGQTFGIFMLVKVRQDNRLNGLRNLCIKRLRA